MRPEKFQRALRLVEEGRTVIYYTYEAGQRVWYAFHRDRGAIRLWPLDPAHDATQAKGEAT
jgi:hypothetical protein